MTLTPEERSALIRLLERALRETDPKQRQYWVWVDLLEKVKGEK